MLMAFFSWWYGAGWRHQAAVVSEQLAHLLDTFSFSLLLKTLFSPFRQISAGTVGGPLGVQLQAWFDRLVSRFIGAMVRVTMMIAGSVIIFGTLMFGVIRMGLWPVLPLVPFIVLALWWGGALSWK